MPELPEVEILKRELKESVIGKAIIGSKKSDYRLRRSIPEFTNNGEKILNIFRRNKYLIIETNTLWLVIHLGMTGKLIYSKSIPDKDHIHFILDFSDGTKLYYEDARRFGSIDIYSKSSYQNYLNIPLFKSLGVEPLSEEFKYESFKDLFNNTKNIKSFLMDAKYVCGIGNIYACEILFLSNINPNRRVDTITESEKKKLYKFIPEVLQKSIDLGGSSISDYVHTNGLKGEMQNFYFTYDRKDENCKKCKNKIQKIKQGGRGTYFCPTCQK
jgi:formamidopyrimidine-DNA glycosylase